MDSAETMKDTAKRMKKAIQAAFPDGRFSVRAKLERGGFCTVTVRWASGPYVGEVAEVADAFQSHAQCVDGIFYCGPRPDPLA